MEIAACQGFLHTGKTRKVDIADENSESLTITDESDIIEA